MKSTTWARASLSFLLTLASTHQNVGAVSLSEPADVARQLQAPSNKTKRDFPFSGPFDPTDFFPFPGDSTSTASTAETTSTTQAATSTNANTNTNTNSVTHTSTGAQSTSAISRSTSTPVSKPTSASSSGVASTSATDATTTSPPTRLSTSPTSPPSTAITITTTIPDGTPVTTFTGTTSADTSDSDSANTNSAESVSTLAPHSGSGLSTPSKPSAVGKIVGGILGGVAGLSLILLLLFCLVRRCRRRGPRSASAQYLMEHGLESTSATLPVAVIRTGSSPNTAVNWVHSDGMTPAQEPGEHELVSESPDLVQPQDEKAPIGDVDLNDFNLGQQPELPLNSESQQADSPGSTGDTAVALAQRHSTSSETRRRIHAMSQRIAELELRERSLLQEVAELAPPEYGVAS